MISVIIPAYKTAQFIDECISSIQDAEILVGVDGCEETLNHLKGRSDIRLFYFTENVGPFIIKNTLINEASHEDVLFFDSDDILAEGTIPKIEAALKDADYVRLSYRNFHKSIEEKGHKMNDAVIAIKRNVFNKLNGFQAWICAADTEFTKRLEHNKIKCNIIKDLCYHRRLHGGNITLRKETGHESPIRAKYVQYMGGCERNKQWPNPEHKITDGYVTYRNA